MGIAAARRRRLLMKRNECLSAHCCAQGYSTVRIDGSTDVTKRQDVVNSFNLYNVGQVIF